MEATFSRNVPGTGPSAELNALLEQVVTMTKAELILTAPPHFDSSNAQNVGVSVLCSLIANAIATGSEQLPEKHAHMLLYAIATAVKASTGKAILAVGLRCAQGCEHVWDNPDEPPLSAGEEDEQEEVPGVLN